MTETILTRTRKAWNVFRGKTILVESEFYGGGYSSTRPDLRHFSHGTDRSILIPLYTRMGIDCAAISCKHARVDENEMYQDTISSALNNCLTVEANIDQSAKAFIQDVVMSLCDEGCVAIVPVDTTSNPSSGTYDIHTLRVGKIIGWYPSAVDVYLYNDRSGLFETIQVSKTFAAICENPFYSVMNAPGSILRRLIEKMVLLDSIDRQSGGKLDLIIQLPFVVKSAVRQQQAETRRNAIQEQLKDGQYGIAYTDATEKITQLNRPVENTLVQQVENLTRMLYSQLGISEAVFNGTANDMETLNYFNRSVMPMMEAITQAMNRTFLTKTARTQKQRILAIRDAFGYLPATSLPDIADKFTRNEILSSNEVRGIIGFRPSSDPAANELRNKNLNQAVSNQNDSE